MKTKRTNQGARGRARQAVVRSATVSIALATMVTSAVLVTGAPAGAAKKTATATTQTSITCSGSNFTAQATATATATATAGDIDATAVSKVLLTSVAKSAGTKIGTALAGWALESIFGISSGSGPDISGQLSQLSTQLTQLGTQIDNLHTQLTDALKKAEWQAERNTYDGLAAQVNQDAATLSDYQIRFDSWLKKAPGSQINAAQSDVLLQMRNNLGRIINDLNNAMTGGAPGARGLIEVYGGVTRKNLPYQSDLSSTRFYTSDYTTPVSNQLDYYEGLVVQAFNMLAEVNHLSWTIGGVTYDDDIPYVETYANCLPKILSNWNQLATSGVGRLPNDTVADAQTGLMWLRSNLSEPGGGNPLPEAFCWAGCFVYPQQSLSTLVTPTKVIAGVTGWRVPSKAEYDALAAGHESAPLQFLLAQGFKWRDGTQIKVNGYPVAVPAYWVNGGAGVTFHAGTRGDGLGVQYGSWLATFLPGPGAVVVRDIG